jgi:hypothetical protein
MTQELADRLDGILVGRELHLQIEPRRSFMGAEEYMVYLVDSDGVKLLQFGPFHAGETLVMSGLSLHVEKGDVTFVQL